MRKKILEMSSTDEGGGCEDSSVGGVVFEDGAVAAAVDDVGEADDAHEDHARFSMEHDRQLLTWLHRWGDNME